MMARIYKSEATENSLQIRVCSSGVGWFPNDHKTRQSKLTTSEKQNPVHIAQ